MSYPIVVGIDEFDIELPILGKLAAAQGGDIATIAHEYMVKGMSLGADKVFGYWVLSALSAQETYREKMMLEYLNRRITELREFNRGREVEPAKYSILPLAENAYRIEKDYWGVIAKEEFPEVYQLAARNANQAEVAARTAFLQERKRKDLTKKEKKQLAKIVDDAYEKGYQATISNSLRLYNSIYKLTGDAEFDGSELAYEPESIILVNLSDEEYAVLSDIAAQEGKEAGEIIPDVIGAALHAEGLYNEPI